MKGDLIMKPLIDRPSLMLTYTPLKIEDALSTQHLGQQTLVEYDNVTAVVIRLQVRWSQNELLDV